jgi:hypothetical protein
MQLVFVDETGDNQNQNYFGLSLAIINSAYYGLIKTNFQKILIEENWDKEIEFKGSCLFSPTRGDTNIGIEKRIDICSKILALNKSKKNARMNFYYFKKDNSANKKQDYLDYLPKLLNKALKSTSKKSGKDLVSLNCDERQDINTAEIFNAIESTLKNKKCNILENVVMSKSSFQTVGILYADIVGYLFGRIDNMRKDIDLFNSLTPEQIQENHRIKKLKTSTDLLECLKTFKAYKVD